jgi:Kef-type K+ transport system membrane component KefB
MHELMPDQVFSFVLLDIAVILMAARALGWVARRLGQPTVAGEIVAGVLLGPTLLGYGISNGLFPSQARDVLSVLGQIALVLYTFLVGLELDCDQLRGKGRGIVIVAVGAVAAPIGMGFVVGPALYGPAFVGRFGTPAQPSPLTFTLFVGAMLAVTAFPVIALILQEKGLAASRIGVIGIASGATVTVLMFLTLAVAAGTGGPPSSLLLKFAATGGFIATLFGVVRPALAPLGRRYQRDGALTPSMFAVILMLLFVCAYVAHRIGINAVVGSFLAGAILPAREGLFREMAARLGDLSTVALLPVFLAFSGLNTDFRALRPGDLPGLGLFLIAGIVGKWLGGAVAARLGGLSWAEGNVLGILLNCRGMLVLIAGLIAFQQGAISAQLQAGGVLMALVTTIMTVPLFDRYLSRAVASGASTSQAPLAPGVEPGTWRRRVARRPTWQGRARNPRAHRA